MKSILTIILWIPLLVLWNQNKEPDMNYYTVYVMDSTKTIIYSNDITYPDTIAAYAMDDSRYDILYFYVTATDTAENHSLPSDTVSYKAGTNVNSPPKQPITFWVYAPYPSITEGRTNIEIQAGKDMKGSIICYNILGQIVLRKKIEVSYGTQIKTINIKGNSGVYFIRVQLNDEVMVRRISLVK